MSRTAERAGALLIALLLVTYGWAQGNLVQVAFLYPQTPANAPINSYFYGIAGESGRRGAELAAARYGWEAQQQGWEFKVLMASAPNQASAGRAARRLIANEGVLALIGGFEGSQANSLSALADEQDVLFINVGSTDRIPGSGATTLHIQPSASTYLRAIREIAEPVEREAWYVVYSADEEGERRLEHARAMLFGGPNSPSEVGSAGIAPGVPQFGAALAEIAEREPTAVLLLLDWRLQLEFLGQLESSGVSGPHVWSLPDSVTTTREFYGLIRNAAPRTGTGPRVVPWEATLASAEAAELNERYEARYGEPMDPPAWAAYQAVKLVFQALSAVETVSGEALLEYLTDPATTLSVDKDTPVAFDPLSRELVQPLYLVTVDPEPVVGSLLEKKRARVTLERILGATALDVIQSTPTP